MANEAVIVDLLGDRGNVMDYTVADAAGIEKGALLMLQDPRTASGGNITTGNAVAGIAATEKVASDGQTKLGLYTNGIFDLTISAGAGVTLGAYVALSGANLVRAATATEVEGGKVLGKALETGSASEVIQVRVNL